MPRPKKYDNPAERQRAFRVRRKVQEQGAEALHYARLEKLHNVVKRAAKDGNENAAIILGKTPSDTALKIILASQPLDGAEDNGYMPLDLWGFNLAYYAYEEAAGDLALKNEGLAEGLINVSVLPCSPPPKKLQSIADRPTATRSAKRNVTAKKSTHRPKKPAKAAKVPA